MSTIKQIVKIDSDGAGERRGGGYNEVHNKLRKELDQSVLKILKIILANEVTITGTIGPAISIWLALQGQLRNSKAQILIFGPTGPAIITSLAKNVLNLLRSFENPGEHGWYACDLYCS